MQKVVSVRMAHHLSQVCESGLIWLHRLWTLHQNLFGQMARTVQEDLPKLFEWLHTCLTASQTVELVPKSNSTPHF